MCALILSKRTIKNLVEGTYSIVQKRHKTKPEPAYGDTVYQPVSVNMEFKSKTVFVFGLTAVLSLFLIISDSRFSAQDFFSILPLPEDLRATKNHIDEQTDIQILSKESESYKNSTAARRIYISMGLCWNQHTKLYKKSNFPYEEAAR